MRYQIRRPGSGRWESEADMPGGAVPLADVVGSLVRYETGGCPLVFKVVGLDGPDAAGTRHMWMEVYEGEGETDG